MISSDAILILVGGFVLGALTYGFIFGYGICSNCWLALLRGKRYETGCIECHLAVYNQHTTLVEKQIRESK